MNDKELDKKLTEKMVNPSYFINENLKIGFKKNLQNHNINHAKSISTYTPKYTDFFIETT